MGKNCCKYTYIHITDRCILFKLFGIFIYLIFDLENGNSSLRSYVLIYLFIRTVRPLPLERMQQENGWAPLCLDLDVCSDQLGLSYTYPEQHLSQNRNLQNGNKSPRQRACHLSDLHVVSEGSSPMLQVYRSIQRKTHIREVRNRTVTECCEGFVQLYSECVPKCPECENIRCNSTTNECTCLSGFFGSRCNETCEDGKWGDRCSEVCICRIGEVCDKATGFCTPRLTEDTSTPAPETQPTTAMPTNFINLIATQSSLITADPTEQVTTSLPAVYTFSKSNSTTAESKSTSHFTSIVTLPPIIPTPHSTSTVENKSTELTIPPPLILSSTTKSIVSTISDFHNNMNTIVINNFTVDNVLKTMFDNELKEVRSNLTSIMSVYNKTFSITPQVREPMFKELPSEIISAVKPRGDEPKELPFTSEQSNIIFTRKPQVKESKLVNMHFTSEPNESNPTVNPQVTEPKELMFTSESSEIIPTLKPSVTNSIPNEQLSIKNETISSTTGIPQENYSKEINVSLESSREFSFNATMMYAQWINELSANSSVTLAAALVLLVLVIVTTSAVVRCCSTKKSNSKQIQGDNTPTLLRNSHYDVPGPPTFSFINAYALEMLTKDIREAEYDHPCSARCLVVNEPVYDELRY